MQSLWSGFIDYSFVDGVVITTCIFGRSCHIFHCVAGEVDAMQELKEGVVSTMTKDSEGTQ